jgi:hypothetical protein
VQNERRLSDTAQVVAQVTRRVAEVGTEMDKFPTVKHRAANEPLSAKDYDRQWHDREFAALKKKAAKLGFSLTAQPT